MALIGTLCLPGEIQLVRLDGHMMLWAVTLSKSCACFSNADESIFVIGNVCVQQRSQKVNKMEPLTTACASVAVAS